MEEVYFPVNINTVDFDGFDYSYSRHHKVQSIECLSDFFRIKIVYCLWSVSFNINNIIINTVYNNKKNQHIQYD